MTEGTRIRLMRFGLCFGEGHCEHVPKFTDEDMKRISAKMDRTMVKASYQGNQHQCCKCKMVCVWVDDEKL